MDEENGTLYLKQYNVTIININTILDNAASTADTKLYIEFDTNKSSNNKLWQKIFYNEYITNLSRVILLQSTKVILYYRDCNNKDYQTIIIKLSKYLPFPVIQNGIEFRNFGDSVKSRNATIISKLDIAVTKEFVPKKYCFQNFKIFLKNHGLEFLHTTYFNQIKNKMILTR